MTRQSKSAGDLFEELASDYLGRPGVGRRRMFGRDGLSVRGKFFAFFDRDHLVVKLPCGVVETLIATGRAERATNLSPTMRTWVSVPMSAADGRPWRQLLADAHAYVGSAKS